MKIALMLLLSGKKVKRACCWNRLLPGSVHMHTKSNSALDRRSRALRLQSLWAGLISDRGGRASPHPGVSIVNISPSR